MKKNINYAVEVEEYTSPSMKMVSMMSRHICQASGDSTHEGLGYDDDNPIFGGNEE